MSERTDSIDYQALRMDIERYAGRLATPPPMAGATLDRHEIGALGARFSEALQTARQKARGLVDRHQAEFPDSPLFSQCSLLRPLDQGRRELSVTQVLGWLLDSKAEHGMGSVLLRAFLSSLGDEPAARAIQASSEQEISVYTEFALDGANRADIVIASGRHAVIVEAKVDAQEGVAQTERYARDFAKLFPVSACYYLTAQGTQAASPGFNSLRYLELARTMIRALPQVRSAQGFHYARYFIAGVLSDICGIQTSPRAEEVLRSNSFDIETLLEEHKDD